MFFDVNRDCFNESVVFGDFVLYVGVVLLLWFIVFEFLEVIVLVEVLFLFKFKVLLGCVYCFQVIVVYGMEVFVFFVVVKMSGLEVGLIGGLFVVEEGKMSGVGFVFSYMDDEGDLVFIIIDNDLFEVILLVCQGCWDKVEFFVYDFEKFFVVFVLLVEILVVVMFFVFLVVGFCECCRVYDDDDEEYEEEDDDEFIVCCICWLRNGQVQEQVIVGVFNEFLFFGVIVMLVVVIVGVFIIVCVISW